MGGFGAFVWRGCDGAVTSVDAVAEAIHNAEMECGSIGPLLYRRLAEAAIEAMGLKEEWCIAVEGGGGAECGNDLERAQDLLGVFKARHYEDPHIESRFASPWVRTDQEPE